MAEQHNPSRVVMENMLSFMGKLRQSNTGLSNHKAQHGDVFVVTFPKSGTTMFQNMLYQLVVEAGGAPKSDPDGSNFKNIGDVVPWAEFPESKEAGTRPRLFKSHMPVKYFNLDDGCTRFVYMYRNGLHLPGSFLDFVVEWMNPGIQLSHQQREEILCEYMSRYFLAPAKVTPGEESGVGRWFQHVKGWTAEKRDNVLVLNYENASEDLYGTTATIAQFLGINVSEDALQRVASKCTREAMVGDERFRENLFAVENGWDPKGGIKVKRKGDGRFKQLHFTTAQRELYDKMFEETFGVKIFEELVKKLQ